MSDFLETEEADQATEAEVPAAVPEAEAVVLDEDQLFATAGGDEGDEEDEAPGFESPYDRPGAWYVVHTYAGYENKVKQNLASMVASLNLENRVFEVVIPMEDVIDFKNGKRVVVQKKMFPGYLLVRVDMDENVWFHIRNTPGVTGFVGTGAKPTPLSRKDVE
ncbi:MAG TPA: transcription termination/antitermination NusG family protein, partial [Acidimicrobiales bacterium]|nr:transcription termination/antitermination NusG family protein [Acidimicrobiales bacterium]